MKTVFTKLTLLIGLLLTLPVFAQTKVLYLVPDGVSPNGKYALTAYAEKSTKEDFESEVAFYLSKVSDDGSLKTASDVIFDWGAEETDVRGYGPAVLSWSIDHSNDGELSSKYVAFTHVSRKSNEVAFARLLNGKYVKQAYNTEKYSEEIEKVVEAKVKSLGLKADARVHAIGSTYVTNDVDSIDDESSNENLELDFDQPLFVVYKYDYTYSTDKEDELVDVSFTGVVNVRKDADGNLSDSKGKFSAVVVKAETESE